MCVQDLEQLKELEVLDVSSNQLKQVEDLDALTGLRDLWLNNNQLPDLEAINLAWEACRHTLVCVYLANNPATCNNPLYKRSVTAWLPNLEQLDADVVARR